MIKSQIFFFVFGCFFTLSAVGGEKMSLSEKREKPSVSVLSEKVKETEKNKKIGKTGPEKDDSEMSDSEKSVSQKDTSEKSVVKKVDSEKSVVKKVGSEKSASKKSVSEKSGAKKVGSKKSHFGKNATKQNSLSGKSATKISKKNRVPKKQTIETGKNILKNEDPALWFVENPVETGLIFEKAGLPVEAFRYYYNAAVKDDAEACFRLASLYEGLEQKDNARIVFWLEKAARKKHTDACFALGKIYHFGRKGIPVNEKKALKYYKTAASQGDKEALEKIELLTNSVPLQDETYGDNKWDLYWNQKFATSGDAFSQYALAKEYEEGKLLPRNMNEAKKWYQAAAERGHVEAQCALAGLYLKSTPPDEKSAFQWYLKAAEADYAQAESKLAEMFVLGKGTPVDIKEAYKWQYLAVTNMFPFTEDLEETSPLLAKIGKFLTDKEKTDIHRNVRPFMRKNRYIVR